MTEDKSHTVDNRLAQGVIADRLVGVHHLGIPVRSLEDSLAWYRELFGIEPEFVEVSEGPVTSQTVQLEDVKLRFAFLRFSNVVIELIEYERPVGRDFGLNNCDVGAMHVCLEVRDIDRVYELLRERGVPFSVEPSRHADGPIIGYVSCYFRGRDGLQFELIQLPAEVAEESSESAPPPTVEVQ